MTTVQLTHLDARLAYLAVQYHLSRPGSELDPETKQPVAHGLAEVAATLEPQLNKAVATVELNAYQQQRLVSAIAGAMNQLRASPLLDERAAGRSTAPAFAEALRRLFPEVAEDPEEATQLAGHLLALRRRLEQLAAPAPAEPKTTSRRPWWRLWSFFGKD